ncbi:hypothetical protein F4802DRAFT_121407 [Xylaria palmicola]|nr:hypothetical protein F4802DRAFT_121407 [Xylaria palmicola]
MAEGRVGSAEQRARRGGSPVKIAIVRVRLNLEGPWPNFCHAKTGAIPLWGSSKRHGRVDWVSGRGVPISRGSSPMVVLLRVSSIAIAIAITHHGPPPTAFTSLVCLTLKCLLACASTYAAASLAVGRSNQSIDETLAMAVSRPALSAASCSQCRSLVLNLFTGSAQRSAPAFRRPPLSYTRAHITGATPVRRFSSLPKPSNQTFDAEHATDASVSKEQPENKAEGDVAGESWPTDVPWYLQVQSPTLVASLEPPPLPETPPDAPPLIRSLLQYASEEMGLDALSLLDLRKLDPPPALGPSLFMLFGTARSERHLNVSAGRLVRWLRATHRVHADADGLLGPNERKIKLRRRARRAKLLGTMGTDDADDGIRTGWICVNLGTVDRSGTESAVVAEDGRVSGFGVSQTGSTIVFQIMTARRREEMGLEDLWAQALDPSLSSATKLPPTYGDKHTSNLHPVEEAILANLHKPSGFSGTRKGHSGGASPPNQARFYSTQQSSRPSVGEVEPLGTSSPEELARVLTYDAHQKQRLLELLRAQLDEMDATTVRTSLGGSDEDAQSTPFMQLMELAMETLPPTQTWGYRLAVQHKASVSGLPKAIQSLDNVRLLVGELRVYSIKATRDQYLQLLSCIFLSNELQSVCFDLALDVLHTMHQRNESIMASDLIVTIIEGVSKGGSDTKHSTRRLVSRLDAFLFRDAFLSRLSTPCIEERLLMRLMTAYARLGHWARVRHTWGVPARHLRSRSANMYIHIFELAFASRSVTICAEVLRQYLPEAGSEDPSVLENTTVRRAALACVGIVDPQALEYAAQPVESQGEQLHQREFVNLARMLNRGI